MSGSNSNKIFNVEDVTGKERVALETTAAEARIEAPNPVIAHQVDANAEEAQEAAHQAAAHAKTMGTHFTGEPNTAAAQFRGDASRTTNAAVEEGKRDVDEVKAVGADYVEQAKALANSAIETAQSYLPSSIGGKPVEEIASNIQNTATGAYTTVKETAQPHVQKVVNTAQGYLGSTGVQGKDLDDRAPASATSAPLESGPYTTTTPYPPTTTGMATKIASGDEAVKDSRPTFQN